MREACKSCRYYRLMSGFGKGVWACHYAIDRGELRPHPAAQCPGYPQREKQPKARRVTGKAFLGKSCGGCVHSRREGERLICGCDDGKFFGQPVSFGFCCRWVKEKGKENRT